MPKFVFPTKSRVATTLGAVFIFQANTPRDVPERFASFVKAAGGRPVSEGAPEKPVEPKKAPPPAEDVDLPQEAEPGEVERVEAIKRVMEEILAEGNDVLLTVSGQPRVAELEKRVGFDTHAEERDLAWDMIRSG